MHKPMIFGIGMLIMLAGASLAFAQWSEPVRISEYHLQIPRAVAVGDTLHVVASAAHFQYIRSVDGGLSWVGLPTPADSFYAADMPDIIYSKGRLHLLWIGYILAPWQYHMYHCSSSDGGTTWSVPHRVFRNASLYLNYPRLAANGDTLFGSCAISQRYLSFRSFDAGAAWQDSTVVEPGPSTIAYWQTPLVSGSRLLMVYELGSVSESLGFEIYYRYSDDWGLNWSDRITLSTPEPIPDYRHSLDPSAYADENGNIVVAWFDYKYGSYCGFSGDILARISRDSGSTWEAERRLIYTQSGEASSCLIWNDTIYVVWMDDYPVGCTHPKICYSASGDWGEYWGWPQVISGMEPVGDLDPFIFRGPDEEDSVFHCVFRSHRDFEESYIYYMRGRPEVSAIEDEEPQIPDEISIVAYPNPFSTSITVEYRSRGRAGLKIEIFDINGRRVRTFDAGGQKGGRLTWDGSGEAGGKLASGIYLLRGKTSDGSQMLRLLFLR